MADGEPGTGEVVAGGEEPEQIWLSWENRIRILTNPAVWGGVLAAFGIGTLVLTILLVSVIKSFMPLLIGAGVFALLMAIFVFVALLIDLFGGFRTNFALTTTGVRCISGKGANRAADAAFWVGVLAGSASTAGAGLLAKSEQNNYIAFPDVTKVKLRPGRRYIVVKGDFLSQPIGLYCLPENYAEAEAILRQQCPGAQFV